MNIKEQLQYLIDGVLNGTYDVPTFCDEFERIYILEEGYEQLSKNERDLYRELCKVVGRFSSVAVELEGVNVHYNEQDVLEKVQEVKDLLK